MDVRLLPGQRSQVQQNKDPSAGRRTELGANFRLLSFVVCRISQGESKTPPLCFGKHHGGFQIFRISSGGYKLCIPGFTALGFRSKVRSFYWQTSWSSATSRETLNGMLSFYLFFFYCGKGVLLLARSTFFDHLSWYAQHDGTYDFSLAHFNSKMRTT